MVVGQQYTDGLHGRHNLGRRREARQIARRAQDIQRDSDRRNGAGVVIQADNLRLTKK